MWIGHQMFALSHGTWKWMKVTPSSSAVLRREDLRPPYAGRVELTGLCQTMPQSRMAYSGYQTFANLMRQSIIVQRPMLPALPQYALSSTSHLEVQCWLPYLKKNKKTVVNVNFPNPILTNARAVAHFFGVY